jgi:hypothetical protein
MLSIHPQARTTPAARLEIAHSAEPTSVLAKRFEVGTEPRRESRRLQLLTGWSHDQANTPLFPRGPRAGGPDGFRAPRRVHLAV